MLVSYSRALALVYTLLPWLVQSLLVTLSTHNTACGEFPAIDKSVAVNWPRHVRKTLCPQSVTVIDFASYSITGFVSLPVSCTGWSRAADGDVSRMAVCT
jgi:hypothetical protein